MSQQAETVPVLCPGCWRLIQVPADKCFKNESGKLEVPDECVKPCPKCGWHPKSDESR